MLIEGKVQLGSYDKKDGSGKVNTVDVIVNQIEFLDKKSDGQAKPQSDSHFFDDGENDIFQPVDDSSDIPF